MPLSKSIRKGDAPLLSSSRMRGMCRPLLEFDAFRAVEEGHELVEGGPGDRRPGISCTSRPSPRSFEDRHQDKPHSNNGH
jgi:hypothetical protein